MNSGAQIILSFFGGIAILIVAIGILVYFLNKADNDHN